MKNSTLTPRKPDFLDALNELRYQRRLSYEASSIDKTHEINLKIKELRITNGWSDTDAREELENEIKEFEQPFVRPVPNPFIRYDLNDENGNARGLSLSIHQLNRYWNHREGGLKHAEALNEALK